MILLVPVPAQIGYDTSKEVALWVFDEGSRQTDYDWSGDNNGTLTNGSAVDSRGSSVKLPPGVSANWWAAVQEDIRRSEYHITWQNHTYLSDLPAAYQAPNRAHNLRTYFTLTGIRVIPRTSATPAWEWGLTLTGYGYAGRVQPVAAAELVVSGNRIEYRRGELTEWYVNDERGLEQGVTLASSPGGRPQGSPLQFDLALLGNLTPALSDDGAAIEFTTPDGMRVLRYSDLRAHDATGRELPACLELTQSGITHHASPATYDATRRTQHALRIIVDDSNAVYPITIDPTLTGLSPTPNWTAEGDQADAKFGWSVGTAGDVNGDGYSDVIVGAPGYDNGQVSEGRAFVYHGSAEGLSARADWTAESDQANALFGRSVGTAGDVNGDGYSDVIVGAPNYDNGQVNEGRAFVYHGSAEGLSTRADWTAESDQYRAWFGKSVGTAGDVNGDGYSDVIVGAHWYYDDQEYEGRAYVYHGSAEGLSARADWTAAESDQYAASFGRSVGTAGDVNGDGYSDVIVGAPGYDNGQVNEGRAYVYHGSAAGLSTTANWTAEGDQAWAGLGKSVGTAGDVNGDGYSDVIVGAYGYDHGQENEGRAYVYHGSATGLSTRADWTAEGDQARALFGYSVGTAGDVNGDGYSDVIVGASDYDHGQEDEGRAYVYHGSAAGLSARADWTAEGDQAYARFGWWSVGTAGDVNGDGYSDVIVGAAYYDNGQENEGRAFVYHGSAAGLSTTANWTAEGDRQHDYFGWSVGMAGDVNGDGYADIIVGAPEHGTGGRVYVYHGSAAGLSTTANWTAESDQAGAKFGWSVGTAGDVNGDGYSDVIVGAPEHGTGGRAFVYHGSAAGLSTIPNWTAEGDQAYAQFGFSVGTAGDVNGDGYSDVIVGAPGYQSVGPQESEGRAFVYHGSATGLSTIPNWMAESDHAGAYFGRSVGTAGDVNGDGYSDVIVGAPGYDNGQVDVGRAFVYHGSATGLATTPNWTARGFENWAHFGRSVGTAGDVNGDGYSDVIVGEPGSLNRLRGLVYVYPGSATGLSTTANWTAEGDQAYAQFGFSVGTAGDVNGDGYSDVIVGAYLYEPDVEPYHQGRAYVYHGSATGLATTANWTAESGHAYYYFGRSVGTAGDVNGDGYSDVIVGAPGGKHYLQGWAYVYYGNGGAGLSLRPRQLRADGSTPIAHLGKSCSPHEFRLAALGRTPFGRGKVKLEWEVKQLGTPFDGTDTQKGSSWTDTGTTGANLNELVSGLLKNTRYHWRVRLLYHPSTTPFQQYSRWLSPVWNGWEEADLYTRWPGQVWYLSSTGGSYIMYKGDATKTAGTVTVVDDGSQIWRSDEAAESDFTFPANTWSGHITFYKTTGYDTTVRVYVGKWDGSNFTPSAEGEYANVSGSNDFSISTSSFTVPKAEWLALKIEDYDFGLDFAEAVISVGLDKSYIASPSSDLGYPIYPAPYIAADEGVISDITIVDPDEIAPFLPPGTDVSNAVVINVNVEDDPEYLGGEEFTDITINVGELDVETCKVYKEGYGFLNEVDDVTMLPSASPPGEPAFSRNVVNNTVTVRLYVGDPLLAVVPPSAQEYPYRIYLPIILRGQ
jgi:hypothetical protein